MNAFELQQRKDAQQRRNVVDLLNEIGDIIAWKYSNANRFAPKAAPALLMAVEMIDGITETWYDKYLIGPLE